ncbi:MAG: hypothetical protein L0H79_21900 [Intrasporangium sp.]|uniref:hypothetical protein n=1 Tax=Intrasporangium sp. TaxID=1925024 RepID=UPI00264916DD|nr:hypothetical protein [Intrasporangium sp.]MDN5798381.1 hypothetical protein [Intrasporangium sp.]
MSWLDGIRDLGRTSRPWHRRIAWTAGVWLALIVLGALLGQHASVLQLAVLIVAVAMLIWYLMDHVGSNAVTHWPVSDLYRFRSHRGEDFRVTNLASRLRGASERGEGRESLVEDLHDQLTTIIRERLYAMHGIVIEEEPRWSQGVMPAELWDFVTHPPDPELYRPGRLEAVLGRIERW